MPENTTSNPTPPATPNVFDKLVPHAQIVAYCLLGVGAAFAIIPIYNLAHTGRENMPVIIWGATMALLCMGGGGLLMMSREGERLPAADTLRLLALGLGGACGFATVLLGLALPLIQYRDELKGGLQAWHENRWVLTGSALAFVGGLALMFRGLLQARAFERTSPALRRLLHGYNAVLGGLLLLCILALINILPYSPVWPLSVLGKPLDMTRTGDFTLKPATVSMLQALNKPLHIYVLLTEGDRMTPADRLNPDLATLLEQARAANGLISWETVSRDLNPEKWRELETTYKVPGGGLLLVYGTKGDELTEHIKFTDIYSAQMRPDFSQERVFQGEYALFGAITSLYEGKSRPIVYFTQGNGELSFQAGAGDARSSMGLFIEELGKNNYDLKPLPFDKKAVEQAKSVPDDAEVVVIAGPQNQLAPEAVEALRKYMNTPHGASKKKGKLIVFFDVVLDENQKMVKTGLEGLLHDFNVEVGDNYVFAANPRFNDPTMVSVIPNPNSKTPIAKAFIQRGVIQLFLMYKPRTIKPAQGGPPTSSADVLLWTYNRDSPDGQLTWAVTDFKASTADLIRQLEKGDREPETLPLAVTVSDSKDAANLPMGHPSTGDQTPRLVVFGNARWLSDKAEAKMRKPTAALVGSCISWLHERPDIGEPPTKETQPTYNLEITDLAAERRLEWLPGGLLVLGLVTVGGGVWVVRRR